MPRVPQLDPGRGPQVHVLHDRPHTDRDGTLATQVIRKYPPGGRQRAVPRIPGVWARPGAWPCRAQTSGEKRACPLRISLAAIPDTRLRRSCETPKKLKPEG